MMKWVSKSSDLETDASFYNYQESPRRPQINCTDSPELFLSPQGERNLNPIFQLSSSNSPSTDSGVGSSKTSLRSTGVPPHQESLLLTEPEPQLRSVSVVSLSSLMVSLPCLLQFPVLVVENGGLVFILIYTFTLLLLVWPSLQLQLSLSSLFTREVHGRHPGRVVKHSVLSVSSTMLFAPATIVGTTVHMGSQQGPCPVTISFF